MYLRVLIARFTLTLSWRSIKHHLQVQIAVLRGSYRICPDRNLACARVVVGSYYKYQQSGASISTADQAALQLLAVHQPHKPLIIGALLSTVMKYLAEAVRRFEPMIG